MLWVVGILSARARARGVQKHQKQIPLPQNTKSKSACEKLFTKK
jgi:hypothetical protein